MLSTLAALVDEFHNTHVVERELGRGGQGVVLRTRDPDTAIKLALKNDEPFTDPEACAEYRERMMTVRTLPVPEGLPLAGPVAMLASHAGYVMRLLEGMQPFDRLFPDAATAEGQKEEDVPSWLGGVYKKSPAAAGQLVHYLSTGALRRRLEVLSRCASILAELHGAGLVYGDVSPSNAYFSTEGQRVWLIDADNLHYISGASGFGVVTPRYGAPELVQQTGCASFRSDCHAFATMAFLMITLAHPFIGDMVAGKSDWEDDAQGDESLEDQALAGRLPWIDDADDSSNATAMGLPRALVLTPRLQQLFQQTFGPGRTVPQRRPAMALWPEALASAHDLATQCSCQMAYFSVDHGTCPYCKSPRDLQLRCEARDWPLENTDPLWVYQQELPQEGAAKNLPRRLFFPFSHRDGHQPAVEVTAADGGLRFQGVEGTAEQLLMAQPNYQHGTFTDLMTHHLTLDDLRKGAVIFAKGSQPRVVRLTLVDGEGTP